MSERARCYCYLLSDPPCSVCTHRIERSFAFDLLVPERRDGVQLFAASGVILSGALVAATPWGAVKQLIDHAPEQLVDCVGVDVTTDGDVVHVAMRMPLPPESSIAYTLSYPHETPAGMPTNGSSERVATCAHCREEATNDDLCAVHAEHWSRLQGLFAMLAAPGTNPSGKRKHVEVFVDGEWREVTTAWMDADNVVVMCSAGTISRPLRLGPPQWRAE